MSSKSSSTGTTVLRSFLAFEAAANLIGAYSFITNPSSLLSSGAPASAINPIISHPASFAPSPQANTLVTWVGAMIFGLTTQLLLALPETPSTVAIRPTVYITMLAGKVALIAVMLWQAFVADTSSVGLTKKALGFCIANLSFWMVWRVWVLVFRPNWFGEVKFADVAISRETERKKE
jgi:hypothetical protein